MCLSDVGEIVASCWKDLPERSSAVALDAFVVMPNHIHGVIVIKEQQPDVGAQFIGPGRGQ